MRRVIVNECLIVAAFVFPATICIVYPLSIGLLVLPYVFDASLSMRITRLIEIYHATGLVLTSVAVAIILASSVFWGMHRTCLAELVAAGRCSKCCYPRRSSREDCSECGHRDAEVDGSDDEVGEGVEVRRLAEEGVDEDRPVGVNRAAGWLRRRVRRSRLARGSWSMKRLMTEGVAFWLCLVLPVCLIVVHGLMIVVIGSAALVAGSQWSEGVDVAAGAIASYHTSWWLLASVAAAVPVSVGVLVWLYRIVVEVLESR